MPEQISIKLFGSFELSNAADAPALTGRKLRALLAYLVLNNTAPQPREKLMAMLWGSHFETQARQNLRKALSRLRKSIGDVLIVGTEERVGIDVARIATDVAQFEAYCADGSREALAAADELYSGEFLEGLHVPEPDWEEWLASERLRLRNLAVDAHVRLASQLLEEPDFPGAADAAQRALTLDPLREDACRCAMLALTGLGRRSDALRHFDEFCDLLKERLGAEPDRETIDVCEQIRDGQANAGQTTAFVPASTATIQPATVQGATPAIASNGYSGLAGLSAILAAFSIVWADYSAGGRLGSGLHQALSQSWGQLSLLAAYVLMVLVVATAVSKPGSRRWLASAMQLDRGGQLYRAFMGKVLDGTDSWFSQEERARGHSTGSWAVCWSPRLFETCLLWAIFYPSVFAMVVWSMAGTPIFVGGQELLPSEGSLAFRLVPLTGFAAVLLSAQLAKCFHRQKRYAIAYPLFLLSIVVIHLSGIYFSEGAAALNTVALATALAGPLAIVFVICSVLAMWHAEFSPVLTIVIAGGFLSSVTLAALYLRKTKAQLRTRRTLAEVAALMVLGFVSLAILGPPEDGLTAAALTIVSFSVLAYLLKLSDQTIDALSHRLQARGIVYGIVVAATLAAMVIVTLHSKTVADGTAAVLILALPFLNSVFDFLSCGLTRFCMRQGMSSGSLNALRWSLIDLLAAILLLVVLSLFTILALHFVRSLDGKPLVSLNAVFTGIINDPKSYWWLYLTFFSTLIPTLVHFSVGCFSFVALAPVTLQRAFARCIGVMEDNGFANVAVRFGLPLLATVALAAPILIVYGLGFWLAENYSNLGWNILRLAIDFAGWLDPSNIEGLGKLLP